MSKPMYAVALGLLLGMFASVAQAAGLSPKALQTAREEGQVRVLVMLNDQAPSAKLANNVLRKKEVATRVGTVLSRMGDGNFKLKRRFALVPAFAVVADAATLQRLAADPLVRRIDIDAPGRANGVPDIASDLNKVSPLQGLGYSGTGRKVAVIDSGVDTDHPDFAGRLIDQQCFCSNISGSLGCCPNDQDTMTGAGAAEDDNGHGSNVAGIIVGKGTVAPRGALPNARLVAVKTLDDGGGFCCSSDIVAAMDWVATKHPDVDVVNLSLGTAAMFTGDCDTATSFTQALAVAVNALVAKGAVVTVSSGNTGSSSQMQAPACARNAFSVGATWDHDGASRDFLGCKESPGVKKPACFTNRSTTTDLYAAGAFVTAPGLNGGSSTYGGTSQAAPMAAACAVALREAVPASTVAEREEVMRQSTSRVTDVVSGRSYPFLDCTEALTLLSTPAGPTDFDFNLDNRADVFWRNLSTGGNDVWRSADATQRQITNSVPNTAWKAVGLADFNGDGKSDVLWRNATTGANEIWLSALVTTRQVIAAEPVLAWTVAGLGDFNGDGKGDIFWRNTATGGNRIWFGASSASSQTATTVADQNWKVAGVGDFNGDGKDDVLWRNGATGGNELWRSGTATQRQVLTSVTVLQWKVAGIGDINGDGKADIVWRHDTAGTNVAWLSANASTQKAIATVASNQWKIAAVADFNGDGQADIFWRNTTTGVNELWPSALVSFRKVLARVSDLNWTVIR